MPVSRPLGMGETTKPWTRSQAALGLRKRAFISCQPWFRCWFSRNVPDCKISGLMKMKSVEEPGGVGGWGGGAALSDCRLGGAAPGRLEGAGPDACLLEGPRLGGLEV